MLGYTEHKVIMQVQFLCICIDLYTKNVRDGGGERETKENN